MAAFVSSTYPRGGRIERSTPWIRARNNTVRFDGFVADLAAGSRKRLGLRQAEPLLGYVWIFLLGRRAPMDRG